jgi:integrative and conjugative element protein (TIGR02256 family)
MTVKPEAPVLTFCRPKYGHFILRKQIVESFCGVRQLSCNAPERGGVLLGRIFTSSGDVFVDKISTPASDDVQARKRFLREDTKHQRFVKKQWEKSGRRRNYLGEWHTHPQSKPDLSIQDRNNIRYLYENQQRPAGLFFSVIVGTNSVCCWEVVEDGILKMPRIP